MNRVCPYCGKEIHEQSGFCPHCTQSLNKRAAASPPRAVPRRAVGVGIAVLLCAALVLGLNGWLCSQPQTYESDTGEALYSGYRLCLSSEEPPVPVPQNGYHAMLDYPYRYPVPLYVTPEDGDELLTDEFMENVEFVTAGIDCSDIYMSISCTEPQQHNEYFPNAARSPGSSRGRADLEHHHEKRRRDTYASGTAAHQHIRVSVHRRRHGHGHHRGASILSGQGQRRN